jgi:hypothetical protein
VFWTVKAINEEKNTSCFSSILSPLNDAINIRCCSKIGSTDVVWCRDVQSESAVTSFHSSQISLKRALNACSVLNPCVFINKYDVEAIYRGWAGWISYLFIYVVRLLGYTQWYTKHYELLSRFSDGFMTILKCCIKVGLLQLRKTA